MTTWQDVFSTTEYMNPCRSSPSSALDFFDWLLRQPTFIVLIDDNSAYPENTSSCPSANPSPRVQSGRRSSCSKPSAPVIDKSYQQPHNTSDNNVVSALYPSAYAQYKPERYNYITPAVNEEDTQKIQKKSGTDVVEYLTKTGRLEVKGAAAEDMRQSIARLIDGSATFRQSLVTGLAVDNSYSIYADSYDQLEAMVAEKGVDLEKDLSKMPEGEWSAFSLLDSQTISSNGNITNYDHPHDAFFNTDIIRQSGSDFNKALDRTVAHEFGHLLLNLNDGNIGEAGANQQFTADIMREMGYAASSNIIPTYATGGESLLVEPKLKQKISDYSDNPIDQAKLMLSLNNQASSYFIPDERMIS